ncbi:MULTISPECIES: hypothetical protein [Streptomyces]|uniref:hypothetical protein n=1 Tax=Streptomyces lycopersici TaxID=2974589 RepID=UPI0021D18109|nr:hypothetical protein [Streptomyces sp. NEAU-383]
MRLVSDEAAVFVFRMWRRGWDSERWVPGTRLLVHLNDGGGEVPEQLSWATEDGAQCALGFSPDMASCYGHRRTADGDVVEVRGELDDQRDHPEDEGGARGYEFDTQAEDTGGWHPAGRLRVLVEDGGEAPVRWVAWHDRSGNACSVALRPASGSGNADVSDLVTAVEASAEHRDAGEVAANLMDASAGKWFAPHNRAFVEFALTEPVPVDRYMLTSANDAPDRDPAAWTLCGSADGRSWRTLDTRSGQSFAHRHQPQVYRIAEPESYDRYRLEITDNNGSPHLQLEAVRFLVEGSASFVGYRQRAGHPPVAYRGVRVVQASPDRPAQPLPEDVSATSKASAPVSVPGFASVPPAPTEHFLSPGTEMVEPYGGGTGIRFKIRNMKIDGQGDVVYVRGGGSHQLSFDVLHDCSECENAVNQVIIGLAGQDRAQASVWNGKQRSGGGLKVVNWGTDVEAMAEDNPGPAEWVNVSCDIVVPDKPGTYSVRARYAQAYQGRLMTAEGRTIPQPEYQDVLGWWKVDRPDGPGPESTIGTIIVEP